MSDTPNFRPSASVEGVEHDDPIDFKRLIRDVEDASDGSDGSTLHNSSKPVYHVMREQPWHRYAIHMMAQGLLPKEIAKACECNPLTIRNLQKQPWAQERLTSILAEQGKSIFEELIKNEDVNSLLVAIELRDNERTPTATRAKIAFDIMDRVHGKATQRVETESTVRHISNDVDALQRELADLEKQQTEMLGAGGGS